VGQPYVLLYNKTIQQDNLCVQCFHPNRARSVVSNQRLTRLNEQFRREIMGILTRDVRDPRIGEVVVTGVEVTSDLWLARVYVQVSGTVQEQKDALEGLVAAQGFIRSSLAKVLKIRRTPELRFLEDKSFSHVRNIEKALAEINQSDPEDPILSDENSEK
jgi:ribosome-binding factor A